VHDSYVSLPKVRRDLRALKTALLEGRLGEKLGTTDRDPQAITCGMRSRALGKLCVLQYKINEKSKVTKLPRLTYCSKATNSRLPE
jgi:hypothetical protein